MSFTDRLQAAVVRLLRWSEKYTRTDMVYLASGGFWLTLELAVAAILSFILAIVFGHYASKDLYGNYKYILSLAALLSGFSLSGIGTAITQSVSKGKEGSLAQGVSLSLRWSIPMSLIAVGVAVYYYFQDNLFVAVSMCTVAAMTPFLYSYSLFNNFLIGRREFSRVAIYSMTGNLISIVALIAALFFGDRAIILVIAYFAANTATAIFFHIRTIRTAKNNAIDPELFRYGFHLSLMGIIANIANQIDSISVFAFLGPANLAIYTYAIAMPEQVKAIVKNIVPLAMPKFANRSIAEIKQNIWGRVIQLTLWLAAGMILYTALAPFLFRFLFPVYISSIPYSQVYAFSIIVTGISSTLVSVLQAHKKTKELYISSNVGPVVLIILLPLFVYLWGIMGAITAQIIYRLITAGATMWVFVKLRDDLGNSSHVSS